MQQAPSDRKTNPPSKSARPADPPQGGSLTPPVDLGDAGPSRFQRRMTQNWAP